MRANHLLESRMRENRPSGLEGGARLNPLSLPYRQARMPDATVWKVPLLAVEPGLRDFLAKKVL